MRIDSFTPLATKHRRQLGAARQIIGDGGSNTATLSPFQALLELCLQANFGA